MLFSPVLPLAAGGLTHTTAASAACYVALCLYGASAVAYGATFARSPRWLTGLAQGTLVAAFLAHGVDIGWRGVLGVHPGMSVREALGFLSWLTVGGYLYWSFRYSLAVLGAFVAPGALIVLAAARLSPSGQAMAGLTTLGRVHISLATLGVAIISLATLVAVVYLMQERALKSKKFDGVLFHNVTALDTLDRLMHRLVLVGFPVFTLALMLGAVWLARRGSDWLRMEYLLALITWGAFFSLIVGRKVRGWRGHQAAVVTVTGFCMSALVLVFYFARRALGA